MRRVVLVVLLIAAAGCDSRARTHGVLTWERMRDQPKYQPYGTSPYFSDGMAMRPLPAGTVAREWGAQDAIATGQQGGVLLTTIPLRPTHELLITGQQRYMTYCRPCHDVDGTADTPVARNMQLRPPPSLVEPRIRALSVGRIFQVISDGYGLMPSYAHQIPPRDRWAVVAYVRALQLRQATLTDLPAEVRAEAERALGSGAGRD